MYPSLIKVYVVPFTLSWKASCTMKRKVESQDMDLKKKKRKLSIVSEEHSTKYTLSSKRTKVEIS